MVKIVCIGDSITFGQLLPPEQAWPQLITGYEIYSAGVPSDTTRLGLERFPRDVQNQSPGGVVIQFGHNDCNRWDTDRGLPRVSSEAYSANLAEMVIRCRVFGAVPFLCTLTPVRRSTRHTIDTALYNELLEEVAQRFNVELIDARAEFGDGEGLLVEDGIHLTEEGHRFYAASAQAVLDRVFR